MSTTLIRFRARNFSIFGTPAYDLLSLVLVFIAFPGLLRLPLPIPLPTARFMARDDREFVVADICIWRYLGQLRDLGWEN